MRDDEKKVLLQQQIEQEIDFDKLTEFCEHLTDAVQEIFRSCGLYFRIFSRNIQQRYAENQKYLQMTSKFRFRFNKEKNLMKQRKTHHIYSCPGCGQKVRIPRGKGKIEIECPKCHTKFVKRS